MPTLAVVTLRAKRRESIGKPRYNGVQAYPCSVKQGEVSESLSLAILRCQHAPDALLALERMLATGNVPILVVRLPSLEMLTITELLQETLSGTTLQASRDDSSDTLHLILARKTTGRLIELLFAKKITKFDVRVHRLPNGEKIILAAVTGHGEQLPLEDVVELPALPLRPGDTGKALHQIEEAVCSVSVCKDRGKKRGATPSPPHPSARRRAE